MIEMSDYWENWWKEHREALSKAEVEEGTKAMWEERGLTKQDLIESGAILLGEMDWPVLVKGYPGLETWRRTELMPAIGWGMDGEFGHMGMLVRKIGEKKYVDGKAQGAPIRPMFLGFEKGLEKIWEQGWVIVVEGVFDRIPLMKRTRGVLAVMTDNVVGYFL